MDAGLKRRVRGLKPLAIGWYLIDDLRWRRRLAAGRNAGSGGDAHSAMSLEESLGYVDEVYDDYLHYGEIAPEELEGARVLEVGPGDNLGVAVRFLAAGAREVVCLEKFEPEADEAQQRTIYAALFERLAPEERARVEGVLAADGELVLGGPLKLVSGHGLEDAAGLFEAESFDLIVSRAVLEHLADPDAALAAADRVLAPGGRSLHKIDFRDHGMFTAAGKHPLEFLTIRPGVYRAMTRHAGRPNRHLIDYYRRRCAELGWDAKLLVSHVLQHPEMRPHRERLEPGVDYRDEDVAAVRAIRPRLAAPYRELPDEDLLASAAFLSARKRAAVPAA